MSTETTQPTAEWQAFLSEPYGFCCTDPAEIDAELKDEHSDYTKISIVRTSALPTERDGGIRLPGTYTSVDMFMEIDLEDIEEPEERAEAWELAKKAAWGMSQPTA